MTLGREGVLSETQHKGKDGCLDAIKWDTINSVSQGMGEICSVSSEGFLCEGGVLGSAYKPNLQARECIYFP